MVLPGTPHGVGTPIPKRAQGVAQERATYRLQMSEPAPGSAR
jgi:hypothetical protein